MLRWLYAHALLATFVLVWTDAFGQTYSQTIRGKVVDAHSGTPIVGATVVIAETDPLVGTATDVDGRFRLDNVDVGRHTLIVSYVGYEPATIPEILVGSGKEAVLEIPISESLLTFDNIVVTGERQQGVPENEMVSVSAMSINVEELSRYAATFDDPARSVLSFPGVRGSGDDVLNEIVVRGNSPRGVLWRIEGVEVPNPNHFAQLGAAGGGISMISNSMLRRSDFYTSAWPGAYGNAISSVFDIQLRNGNNEQHEYAFEAGIIGIQASAEGPFSRSSNASYLANYRYSALGLLQDIGLNIPGIIRFQDLAVKVQAPTSGAGQFTLWGLGGLSSQTIDAEPDDPYREHFDQKYGVAGLKHTLYLGSDTYVTSTLTGVFQGSDWGQDSLAARDEAIEDFDNGGLRIASTINRKFSARHSASVGGIYSRLIYNYRTVYFDHAARDYYIPLSDSGHTSLVEGFGQWQYRITETLTFNAGVHYTRLAFSGSDALEPRAGFRWQVARGHVLTGGFGLHSRAETPAIYLARRQDASGRYYQPNLNLGLTRARHYVAGYENDQIRNVRLKTEIYYQDLFDVPVIDPSFGDEDWMLAWSALNATDGYTNLPLVSEGTGRNYGVEVTVERYFTGSFYLLATGSYFQSKYTLRDGSEFDTHFNGNFIANVLGGKEFSIGRSGNNLISFNARLLWTGNNRQAPIDVGASQAEGYTVYDWSMPYAVRLDDYFRIDLGVRYIKNTPNLTHSIALNIQNVTNRLNEMDRYWSGRQQQIVSEEQFGILPNLSYRIEF